MTQTIQMDTAVFYPSFLAAMWEGSVNAQSKFALMLLHLAHYDSAHSNVSDVRQWEVEGTGYTAGGYQLGRIKGVPSERGLGWHWPAVKWVNATFKATRWVVYEVSTGDLMLMVNMGIGFSVKNGTIEFNDPSPLPGMYIDTATSKAAVIRPRI